jgi:hypothetical protein
MPNTYLSTYLYIAACFLILTGAIAWCLTASHTPFVFIMQLLVAFSAGFLLIRRDFYLPFLGSAAFPCGSMVEKTPEAADKHIRVNVGQPGANVIFWAAEPANDVVANPLLAYSKNANAGVTRSDEAGIAMLSVRSPARYNVPGVFGEKTLDAHIHYRVCSQDGMLSRVETVKV